MESRHRRRCGATVVLRPGRHPPAIHSCVGSDRGVQQIERRKLPRSYYMIKKGDVCPATADPIERESSRMSIRSLSAGAARRQRRHAVHAGPGSSDLGVRALITQGLRHVRDLVRLYPCVGGHASEGQGEGKEFSPQPKFCFHESKVDCWQASGAQEACSSGPTVVGCSGVSLFPPLRGVVKTVTIIVT